MLLDTSGLFCCLDDSDSRHEHAVTFFEASTRRLTHSYVLDELVALAHARDLPRPLALGFSAALLDDPDLTIIWVDRQLHRDALTLLQSRLDKAYSLCDAVSFVLMRERGMADALTTDRHFEQEGFRRLLNS